MRKNKLHIFFCNLIFSSTQVSKESFKYMKIKFLERFWIFCLNTKKGLLKTISFEFKKSSLVCCCCCCLFFLQNFRLFLDIHVTYTFYPHVRWISMLHHYQHHPSHLMYTKNRRKSNIKMSFQHTHAHTHREYLNSAHAGTGENVIMTHTLYDSTMSRIFISLDKSSPCLSSNHMARSIL